MTINYLESKLSKLIDEIRNQKFINKKYYLNIKKKIEFAETTLEVNVGVTNAYNRENVFYFDRVKFKRVNQLPMLPSFGVNWKF